jgi:hypothetical protein
MTLLRYCPHEIRTFTAEDQFIENFELHNIIVILFKLASTNAESSFTVVKEHDDPIMRMA